MVRYIHVYHCLHGIICILANNGLDTTRKGGHHVLLICSHVAESKPLLSVQRGQSIIGKYCLPINETIKALKVMTSAPVWELLTSSSRPLL